MSGACFIVSGGSGFLGQAVLRRLREEGAQVVAPTRADLDWRDRAGVAELLAAHPSAAILHLASGGVRSTDPDDPAIQDDELAMAESIGLTAESGTRVIYAGSMAEYGRSGRLCEDDAIRPANSYARAKAGSAALLDRLASERGFELVHARLFGLYGPGEAEGRLLPALVSALHQGRRATLSDGLQKRDFVHVDDAAQAMIALATSATPPGTVNIGTGHALVVREVIERLADEIGADRSLLGFGDRARSPHDQDVLEADTRRLKATLGWSPPQRLASGPILPHLGFAAGENG